MSIEEIASLLFVGFVEGGNNGNYKAPFLNRKLQNWDKAKSWRYICGVLCDDVVFADYDDAAAFECRLRIAEELKQHCIAIRSPNRGGHFFWLNRTHQITKALNGAATMLTLQPTDYKAGVKTKGGQFVRAKAAASLSKEDGTLREIVYCNTGEDGTLDELPFYDAPLDGWKTSFLGLKVGDGRQEAIFSFMIPLKRAGLTYEQYLEVAGLIDRFIFADSLGDEFPNATRREAWDNVNSFDPFDFVGAKGFLHYKFADFLIEKHHICKLNGHPHIYNDGHYTPAIYGAADKLMLDYLPMLTKSKRNETFEYLRHKSPEREISPPRYIAFRNGILDVETAQLTEHSPEIAITNCIPWRYVPDAHSDMLDDFLNRVSYGNGNIVSLLEEIGGACLYRDNKMIRKAFLLVGEGSNGKSTFIDLLKSMLGAENCSSLDFRDLDKRFQTAELFGKLANLGDDIADGYVESVSTFKKIVSGERLTAEQKGRDPFSFEPYCKLVFSANTIPRFSDRSGAALNRLIMIPFEARFIEGENGYDPHFRAKIIQPEIIEAFISKSVKGLQRVLKVGKFTDSKEAETLKNDFKIENNPILAFIEESRNENGEIEGIFREPTEAVYRRYTVFCSQCGVQPVSKIGFCRQIKRTLGIDIKVVRFGKRVVKVFTEP